MFQQSFPCNEQFQSPYYEPVIQFSKYHKTEMELEKLRLIGDEICEKAVTFIETIKNSDISNSNCPLKFRNTLNLMRAHIENESNPNLDVVDFLSGVSTIPEWVDFSQIERGQFSLIKYSFPTLCLSLLHSSLVGGVSSPKINAVLISTGYLSGSLTFQRLIETTHWLIDIMKPGSLVPGRKGWRSTISVRILHEKVRQTIKRKISRKDSAFDSDFPVSKRKKSNYDIQKYGVPINQEDMIATALSFFGIYFDTFPRRLGIVLQERELLDILAVWRYVSFLMGIQDDFNPAINLNIAKGYYESIILHLVYPDESSRYLANELLQSVSLPFKKKPVFYTHKLFLLNTAISRHLLGDNLSNDLGLVEVPLWSLLLVQLFILFSKLLVYSYDFRILKIYRTDRLMKTRVTIKKCLNEFVPLPNFELKFPPQFNNKVNSKR